MTLIIRGVDVCHGVQGAARLVLASAFFNQSAVTLMSTLHVFGMDDVYAMPVSVHYAHLAANLLLLWVAVWTLFGICSRQMASIGLALIAGLALSGQLIPFANLQHWQQIGLLAIIAMPIILRGGGSLALYRAGWRRVM